MPDSRYFFCTIFRILRFFFFRKKSGNFFMFGIHWRNLKKMEKNDKKNEKNKTRKKNHVLEGKSKEKRSILHEMNLSITFSLLTFWTSTPDGVASRDEVEGPWPPRSPESLTTLIGSSACNEWEMDLKHIKKHRKSTFFNICKL